ncbi:lipopolysaccharide biosynthesis protein [Lachnospiraceae bacterium PFB1-21]
MIIKSEAKRLMIYFFYDADGIVDKYVEFFLDDVKKSVSEIIVVCNGKLTEDGNKILSKYGDVIVRENKGFDVWAYKEALMSKGWDQLNEYDEVILANSTIMGPIYSFSETFEKMDKKDLDFWGITLYFEYEGDPFGYSPYGYLPDHIQSHWIACRRSLVSSKEFQNYWEEMPMIENYEQAVGKHESIFTKKFADLGFKWDISVEMEDLRQFSGYPLMMCPKLLLAEKRCPIFKKRSFFHMHSDLLRNTTGEPTREMFDFIDQSTEYDTELIWQAVIRGVNQYDLFRTLGLMYTLPTHLLDKELLRENLQSKRVALVMHIYFTDLLEESYHSVSAMPAQSDIYLTTDTAEKKRAIEERFADFPCNKLEVRLIENRGRDVSALLVGVKDVIMSYDLVCFVHDKKTAQVKPGTVGASFGYKCFENTLSNEVFVGNVINTFFTNEHLGMLSPPEPNHAEFYPTMGLEWGPNFDVTKELAEDLGITVPMSAGCPPLAPLGTMFWFRPCAMKSLFDRDWNYSDFPKEPNEIDGTLLHAIERIYPFVVQNAGYYPGILMSDKFAAIEYNNLKFYIRGISQYFSCNGIGPYYEDSLNWLGMMLSHKGIIRAAIKMKIKQFLKRVLPKRFHKPLKQQWRKMKG